MELKQKAQEAVDRIGTIVGADLSADQRKAVDAVIEDLVIEAMRECAATCGHAASACCSEDEDMAHKVAQEVKQAQEALVANLSSLR